MCVCGSCETERVQKIKTKRNANCEQKKISVCNASNYLVCFLQRKKTELKQEAHANIAIDIHWLRPEYRARNHIRTHR